MWVGALQLMRMILPTALNDGKIAAAALDTTKVEPLDANSSLWTAKNCFISAHDSPTLCYL